MKVMKSSSPVTSSAMEGLKMALAGIMAKGRTTKMKGTTRIKIQGGRPRKFRPKIGRLMNTGEL